VEATGTCVGANHHGSRPPVCIRQLTSDHHHAPAHAHDTLRRRATILLAEGSESLFRRMTVWFRRSGEPPMPDRQGAGECARRVPRVARQAGEEIVAAGRLRVDCPVADLEVLASAAGRSAPTPARISARAPTAARVVTQGLDR